MDLATAKMNRRCALKLAVSATATLALSAPIRLLAAESNDGFIDARRPPDAITVMTEGGTSGPVKSDADRWEAGGVIVQTTSGHQALRVTLSAPRDAVKQIRISWKGSTSAWKSVLGDHWERSYGDLAWSAPDPSRPNPWYLLAHTESGTHAVGVRTQPNAFCAWMCNADGLTLVCDVRSGGVGVALGERTLHVCDVVARRGQQGESAFAAACAFCRVMSPKPRLADHVIYGANDWYYAYGRNTPAGLLKDAEMLSDLTSGLTNRPYCVIDDGWQTKEKVELGQWSATRPTFGSMSDLAASMAKVGVIPGIWMRPLIDEIKAWPAAWHMSRDAKFLDPTLPDVKQIVANDIKRLCAWGYRMIKHDFSTIDIVGRWGKDMKGGEVTSDGWSFASRAQTTAEVINDLYRTMRDAAGDAVIIGCNTVSHLSAGVFEVNRIGDDTSGNEWRRNPQMGVNTLAFRAPQQASFYAADADCCAITTRLPWAKARQWLDLVARSGTPLFVSVDRRALTEEIRPVLRDALATASKQQPLAEPLDWMTSPTPSQWSFGGTRVTYDWS